MAAELLKCFATGVALFAVMAVVVAGIVWLLINHWFVVANVVIGLILVCAAIGAGAEYRYWRDQINGRG